MLRRTFLFAPLFLAGCSSTPQRESYDLLPKAFPSLKASKARGALTITEPKALASYDTDRVAVKTSDGSLAYLPDAVYSDRLPRLLQARVTQLLENSGRGASVSKAGDRAIADYALLTEIRAFHYLPAEKIIYIELSVKIMNEKTGRILDAMGGKNQFTVNDSTTKGIMQAFESAMMEALTAQAMWIMSKI